MHVDVTTGTTIARPVAEVAAYMGDPANAPQWYANIVRVTPLTPPPYAVGSRMEFEARFLGRTLLYTYEILALDDDGLTMATRSGPFPMTTVYTWRAAGDEAAGTTEVTEVTEVTLRNHGEPSGFGSLGAPVMRRAMARANRADLERLRSLLEG